jgi:uncharacterized repeat protein (TIGR02543 family)
MGKFVKIQSRLSAFIVVFILSMSAGCASAPGGSGSSSSTGASSGGGSSLSSNYTEVIYNGNGNTGGNSPVIMYYTNGETVMVYGDIGFSKNGYEFNGWNTSASGSGAAYIPGQTFTIGTVNLTLYAQWAPAIIYTIVIFAGNGTNGYSGDGGPAASAEIWGPGCVCADQSGNIYIVDRMNCVIRKVNQTGIISTFAGGGSGWGPATNAYLCYPSGVAADSSGNIYIADSGNNMIKVVSNSDGNIYAMAGNGTQGYSGDGGPATNANLFGPSGVFVDSSGNVYISDTFNNRIRVVSNLNGYIYTVAGTGAAGYSGDGGAAKKALINYPYGIFVDSSGDIFIADCSNNCIREVRESSGIISTVAGDGMPAYTGEGTATIVSLYHPEGVYADTNGNIYIADTANNRIRLVNCSTGLISTFAGNGNGGCAGNGGPAQSAELNWPAGVCGDRGGNIYVADCDNNIIWKVIVP